MRKETDILFESGDYFVVRGPGGKGFEVYHQGLTHAIRCAQIGYPGDKGLQRAKQEIERRQTS